MATARTEIAVDRVAAELLRAVVDEVRTLPAHWQKLSEEQQGKAIERLREVVKAQTAVAVQIISQGVSDVAHVKVESVTVKDGSKIVLKSLGPIHRVIDHVSKNAVLVMCDPEQYTKGLGEVQADKDQPDLPLDGSAPAAPAVAGPVPLTANVQVGDRVRFLNASPDGLVRDVRTVNRDADPPTILVTGLPDAFAIDLFELVIEDPIAEAEAQEAAERMSSEGGAVAADDESRASVETEADDEDGEDDQDDEHPDPDAQNDETEQAEPEQPSRRRRAKA